MKDKNRYEKLLSVLPSTKEDAVSMKELSRLLGVNDRDARQCVLNARKEGLPVLSDEGGYWKSDDEHELDKFITQRRGVAKLIYSYTQRMKKRGERHSEKE